MSQVLKMLRIIVVRYYYALSQFLHAHAAKICANAT